MKTKIFLPFLILGIIAIFSACKNEDPEYPVKIYAKFKGSNAPVQNANVRVSQKEARFDLVTDNAGLAKYTFKLPAIYDVTITKTLITLTDTVDYYGYGVIKLEEDQTVEKTILLDALN